MNIASKTIKEKIMIQSIDCFDHDEKTVALLRTAEYCTMNRSCTKSNTAACTETSSNCTSNKENHGTCTQRLLIVVGVTMIVGGIIIYQHDDLARVVGSWVSRSFSSTSSSLSRVHPRVTVLDDVSSSHFNVRRYSGNNNHNNKDEEPTMEEKQAYDNEMRKYVYATIGKGDDEFVGGNRPLVLSSQQMKHLDSLRNRHSLSITNINPNEEPPIPVNSDASSITTTTTKASTSASTTSSDTERPYSPSTTEDEDFSVYTDDDNKYDDGHWDEMLNSILIDSAAKEERRYGHVEYYNFAINANTNINEGEERNNVKEQNTMSDNMMISSAHKGDIRRETKQEVLHNNRQRSMTDESSNTGSNGQTTSTENWETMLNDMIVSSAIGETHEEGKESTKDAEDTRRTTLDDQNIMLRTMIHESARRQSQINNDLKEQVVNVRKEQLKLNGSLHKMSNNNANNRPSGYDNDVTTQQYNMLHDMIVESAQNESRIKKEQTKIIQEIVDLSVTNNVDSTASTIGSGEGSIGSTVELSSATGRHRDDWMQQNSMETAQAEPSIRFEDENAARYYKKVFSARINEKVVDNTKSATTPSSE